MEKKSICLTQMCVHERFVVQESLYPLVMVGLFVETGTPFLEEMLAKVSALDYPKHRMHLFVHNQVRQVHFLCTRVTSLLCLRSVKIMISWYLLCILYLRGGI